MTNSKNYSGKAEGHYHPYPVEDTDEGRISLFHFISDLPHAIFHVDRGILFNFRQLFMRPATSIQEYLDGHRKKYFHPASYLVIALLVNYLVVKLMDLHLYDEQELLSMSPLAAQAILDYDQMQWWFLEHTYIYILIAIPASTLFMHLIFRSARKRLNVAETAVVVLFTIAQGVFIQSLIYLSFGWVKDGSFLRGMESVNMAILILYASFVTYQLLSTLRWKVVRAVVALFGGIGLALVWMASAYLPYYLLH